MKNIKKYSKYISPLIKIDKIPVEEGFCISNASTESMKYLKNENNDEWDW